ncbi:MAG: hypothetical protein KIT58_14260 [Planctomycetota bacterium]|nr:hypothetical protein [Planctomycetota bacterium]
MPSTSTVVCVVWRPRAGEVSVISGGPEAGPVAPPGTVVLDDPAVVVLLAVAVEPDDVPDGVAVLTAAAVERFEPPLLLLPPQPVLTATRAAVKDARPSVKGRARMFWASSRRGAASLAIAGPEVESFQLS